MVMPALSRAFRDEGPGPTSMIVGSVPTNPAARMRARGFNPSAAPFSSEPTSTRAAPSTMPDELPAVCTWLMRFTWGYLSRATASNRASPIAWKAGLSVPSTSAVVSGRMVSSWARTTSPAASLTGTSDLK